MRRASAPAICLKVTVPRGPVTVTRFCSFSVEAFSSNAAIFLPGL